MKRRELTPEEKKDRRQKLVQISIVSGIVCSLMLIMQSKMSLDLFHDWKIIVVNIFKRCMDFGLAYTVSLFFRFKSNKIQVVIIFVLSILFDELFVFQIDMDYLSENLGLFIAVFIFNSILFIANGLHEFNSKKIDDIIDSHKKRVVKIIYYVTMSFLQIGMIVTNVLWIIEFYKTHGFVFSLIPIE